jgi:hypothetical protein
MAQLAGVTADRNQAGQITMLHIDVTKNIELVKPILQTLGLEDDDFDKDWNEGGFTIEEARKHLHKKIDSLPWKKQA